MSEKKSEKSKMWSTSVEFAQYALRERVAPSSIGPKKTRLRHAIGVLLAHDRRQKVKGERRELQWSENRVRDCWYADPRISPNADQIRDLEEITGLRYGREELASVETLIARADTLLEGADADFYRPFVAAFRAFARALDRSGTEG